MAKSQEELLQELIDLQKSNSGNRGGYGAQPTSAPKTGGGVGFSGADMEKAGTTAVGKLGGAAGGIASAIGDSAETWRQASQIGIGFNNDAIGLRSSIAGTRLSTDEWRDSIEKGRQGFTALGGTMSDSAKRFNQLSTEMSNMPVADEMRKIGISTKEYNDVLAISLAGKKFGDFADAESRKKANLAAADLALEMDKVAQLTGVSRREQQEALQEKQKNARVQATVEMQLRAGGQDAADAYKKMTTQMKGMGLDKLSDEIYTGQALSAKSIATLSALGPAGNQLREAINNVRDAKTKEARDAADIALRKAQSAVSEQVSSDQSLSQIRYGQGEVAEELGKISIATRNSRDGIAAVQAESLAKGKKLTDDEARLELEKRANLNKNIASGKAEADARAELAKATNPAEKAAAEEKLKQATAAKTTEAYTLAQARYNDTIAAATILLTKFNTSITAPGEKAGDGLLDKPLKGLANVQTNKKGEESTALDRGGLIGTDRFGKLSEAVEKGNFKEAGTQIGLGAVEVFKNLKDIATGALNVAGDIVYKSAKSDLGSKPAGSYAEGTAGAGFDFTKIVRDFGAKSQVELHGEEAVLTKKQLTDMLSGIQTSIPKMSAGIDMSKLPPISTTVSSSTTGGESSTIKIPNMSEMTKKFETSFADFEKFEEDKLLAIRYGQDEVTKITESTNVKDISNAIEKTTKLADVAKTTEAVVAKEIESKKVVSESSKVLAMQQELIAKGAKIKADGIMGPLTKSAMSAFNTAQVKATDTTKVGNLSKTIPSEVAQAKAEEEKRRAAATTVVPAKPQAETATGPAIKTTQDDLYEQLIQLNTKMQELVSHSSEMATTAEKQVRATKRLDPNVALR
jgi:peptidoglycan hydrolase-like protein with peptidoglycan-binding domain